MNRYDSCQDELIMFSYLCGTVYLVIASLFTGDLQEGIMFLHQKVCMYGHTYSKSMNQSLPILLLVS